MIAILLLALCPTAQAPTSQPEPDAISGPAHQGVAGGSLLVPEGSETNTAQPTSGADSEPGIEPEPDPKSTERSEARSESRSETALEAVPASSPAPGRSASREPKLPSQGAQKDRPDHATRTQAFDTVGLGDPIVGEAAAATTGSVTWPAAEAASPAGFLPASEDPKAGLLGLGLGIEVPLVGIFGGVATKSRVGAGFTFGGAITYDITPGVTLRLHATWGETRNASAPLSFRLSGVRQNQNHRAEWLTFDMGLGAAYRWRNLAPMLAPFLGIEAGVALMDGFEFTFDESLVDLVYDKDQRRLVDNGRLFAQDVAFIGGGRFGVRLDLDTWLASLVEVRISYIHGGEDPVNNTLKGPDVRTVPEHIWLLRGTFAVWVGL